MDSEVYAIVDVDGYAKEMRFAAAKELSEDNNDNLDDYISIGQIINLINNECLGFDNNDRPLLNQIVNEKIFESTVIWIHNVGLAKLASQGLIECAWDDESDEMIFWAAKKEKKTNEKKPRKSKRKNMGDQK